MITKLTYSVHSYPFRELFSELIWNFELETLHTHSGFEDLGTTPGKDNNSRYHDMFYRKMKGSYFMDCYNYFIRNIIRPQFSESIVFQKYPTLRIQIPEGKGVADYHVDSEYHHQKESLNIWLPFTNAEGTASIYIESEPGLGNHTPQTVKYGEYLKFNGCELSHGNEINKTGQTRISIDFRIIKEYEFVPSELKGLAHGKIRTTEGENSYYSIIK